VYKQFIEWDKRGPGCRDGAKLALLLFLPYNCASLCGCQGDGSHPRNIDPSFYLCANERCPCYSRVPYVQKKRARTTPVP